MWEAALTVIGGVGVLLTTAVYFGKTVITHLLDKDVEKFKAKLQAASERAILDLQHSRELQQFEHQVRFSKIYERRADVIEHIHGTIIDLREGIGKLQHQSEAFQDQAKELSFGAAGLGAYIQKSALYLTPMEYELAMNAVQALTSPFITSREGARSVQEMKAQFRTSWEKAGPDISKAQVNLLNSFRAILGMVKPPESKENGDPS